MDTDHVQPSQPSGKSRPLLLTFSGIDGAGKTTQIENLLSRLNEAGLRVRLMRFWDDIAVFRRLRETASHAVFKGDKGVGTVGKPVRRMDKNVRAWYMLPVRLSLCFLDTLGLLLATARIEKRQDADVIIFDRYLYDQLANLDISHRIVRSYVRLLLTLVRRPCIAYLLDADPSSARARKPEYSLEFLRNNRARYIAVGGLAGMTVIDRGTAGEVAERIRHEFIHTLARLPNWQVPYTLTSTSD